MIRITDLAGWIKFKAEAVDNDGDNINNYHLLALYPPGSSLGILCTFSHYNSVNSIIPFIGKEPESQRS